MKAPDNSQSPEAGEAFSSVAGPGRRLIQWVDRFNALLLALLSAALAGLLCLGLLQVFSRYVLGQPNVWSEEVIRYALIWMVFLGAGIAVKKGMLAAVEVVEQLLSPRARSALLAVSVTISALFWLVLLIYGIRIFDAVAGMRSGALEMPMPLVYLAIPVGALIALINTVAVAFDPPKPSLETTID